jgi:hypothetical protein
MIKIKNKRNGFLYLGIVLISIVALGLFVQSCSNDFDINEIDKSEFETYLSLNKSDFDFARDWESLSEIDKKTFQSAKKRMDITFEKNGICKTKWTSSSQVNMSDELFEYFINMIAFTNEVTKELSQMQWINPPRLKSGSESDRSNNCVVQSLYYVLQWFGAPYSLNDIDNWVYSNNYYTSDGGASTAILSHYLSGQFLHFISYSLLANFSSSYKYILILEGTPLHAVVFTGFSSGSHMVYYYDPQNNVSGSCYIDAIRQIFMATGYY